MKNKKTKWLYVAGVAVLVVAFLAMANYGVLGENLQGRLKVARKAPMQVEKVQKNNNFELKNVAVEDKIVSAVEFEAERLDPNLLDIAPTVTECENMHNVLLWNGSSFLSDWMTDNNFTVADGEFSKP